MSSWYKPTLLEGQHLRLEPLEKRHYPFILEALEPDVFAFMNPDPLRTESSLRSGSVHHELRSMRMPFVTISKQDERVIGSTSFYLLSEASRTVEIGGTWLKKVYQGKNINTEAKYLMFKHAFETWHCIRVRIRTHDKNEQSKRAIEKLGAYKEGVIRNESIFKDGSYRNTALYSVINLYQVRKGTS